MNSNPSLPGASNEKIVFITWPRLLEQYTSVTRHTLFRSLYTLDTLFFVENVQETALAGTPKGKRTITASVSIIRMAHSSSGSRLLRCRLFALLRKRRCKTAHAMILSTQSQHNNTPPQHQIDYNFTWGVASSLASPPRPLLLYPSAPARLPLQTDFDFQIFVSAASHASLDMTCCRSAYSFLLLPLTPFTPPPSSGLFTFVRARN